MKTVQIKATTEYPIFIGHDLFKAFTAYCLTLKKRFVIITDDHLKEIYGDAFKQALNNQNIPVELIYFPAGEKHKTRETKQKLEDTLLEKQYGRDTCLIALGGGVVTDIAGFLAATYYRGIPVIYMPTTLLAMVDASIGGKTAVNTPFGKNLIGTFTQPHSVWIDTERLTTLPKAEWYNGWVEMLKHGLIADKDFFNLLSQQFLNIHSLPQDVLIDMIYQSCIIKKNIVEQDECEKGMRQLLNFGHTIGHAIETLEDYTISHGKAVAIGIMVESYIALQLGIQSESVFTEIHAAFKQNQSLWKSTVFKNPLNLHQLLQMDKKSIANIPHFVLLNAIGVPLTKNNQFAFPVDHELINKAIDWAKEELTC